MQSAQLTICGKALFEKTQKLFGKAQWYKALDLAAYHRTAVLAHHKT